VSIFLVVVTGDVDSASRWVEDPITLRAGLIAHKDHRPAPIVKLL
jgi:hypothetical protein